MTDGISIGSALVAPFLVVLRESIEAALIVGIMWAYLDKTNNKEYQRYLAYGTIGAIALSLVLGGGIVILLGELAGFWEKMFEGVAAISATLVLSYVIIWMAKHAGSMKGELETKIDFAITEQSAQSLAFLAFVAVTREGLETVLFLDPTLSLAAKRQIYALDIGKFFNYTSLILIVFAAGLFGYGVHELVEAAEIMGIESPLFERAWDINPESKEHPLHENGAIGVWFKALVGYDGNPEWIRVISYLGYWALAGRFYRKTFGSYS